MSANREIGYGNMVSQRTPCVLLLDTSGSMTSVGSNSNRTRIDLLNEGVRQFSEALLDDEVARNRVRIALVTAGGTVQLVQGFQDAIDFVPPQFTADGATPLGEGMLKSIELVTNEKASLKSQGVTYTRPFIVTISDGAPTDEASMWQQAISASRAAEAAKGAQFFSLAVDGGDLAKLSEFSAITKAIPIDSAQFKDFFIALSVSVIGASRAAPGQPVQLPATNGFALVGA